MNLDRYDFITNKSFLDFEFESEGPNGKIRKVVRYNPINANGITYFNLGFGDLDIKTGRINNLATSNNQDTNKILATVASTVLIFTEHFPDVLVYAAGSTSTRTRLYQIGINVNWAEINTLLHVYGFSEGKWNSFEKGINYEAFLALRKKI